MHYSVTNPMKVTVSLSRLNLTIANCICSRKIVGTIRVTKSKFKYVHEILRYISYAFNIHKFICTFDISREYNTRTNLVILMYRQFLLRNYKTDGIYLKSRQKCLKYFIRSFLHRNR